MYNEIKIEQIIADLYMEIVESLKAIKDNSYDEICARTNSSKIREQKCKIEICKKVIRKLQEAEDVGPTERVLPGGMADISAVKIEPRKPGNRGGYLCMPLRQNVPEGHKGWKLVKCPECGQECWERPLSEGFSRDVFSGALCTMCAMKK